MPGDPSDAQAAGLTDRALDDLEQIDACIPAEDPVVAEQWVEGLLAAVQRAVELLLSGRVVRELGRDDVREGPNSRRALPVPAGPSARCTIPVVGRPLHELVEANVRRHAAAKSMSLGAVARSSGITLDLLLAIFSGEYDPDLELVGKIADSLGITTSDLFAEPEFN